MKLTHGNLSPLEFSPTQDPAGGCPIVFWSMDRQSLSSQLTHSSLAHENVYHLCDNYMKKNHAYIYAMWNWAFNKLLRQNTETYLIYLFNTLRPKQNVRHFPDDIFKCIFLVKIMAWRRPGDSHYLNHWWLVYRRIYVSFGPNELMSMFAITLISPTSLSNGKFLGRAIVPFTMVENLFQDWDTVLKKYYVSQENLLLGQIYPEPRRQSRFCITRLFFLTKWPGWWLGADKHLNGDGEIKCTSLHFENTMFET